MNTEADAEARITELEIKLSYVEDTLERLNDVVVWQQAQIELLLRGVAMLNEQPPSTDAPSPRSGRDDLPPHY